MPPPWFLHPKQLMLGVLGLIARTGTVTKISFEAGASRAPVFVITSPSEAIDAERSHIHCGFFAIHHLGEQFAGGRAQGKALVAVAEGEP